jgi:quercetin dioxygenase-like cupin family protein
MLRLHRLLLPGLGIAAYLFAQGAPPPLENDQVRVVFATDKPHARNAPHEHKLNRVMIYVNAGEQEIITQSDGKKNDIKFKAGDVKWSPSNGMHTSEILSNDPVKLIEVEVKKPGDPSKTATTALDPLKVSPNVYHLEFENDQVRVMRVHFAPHQSVPQHEHVLNRVVVYLTDQHSKLTKADGTVEDSAHKAGEVSWGGPVKHIEENVLGTAVEAIVVEFKS